MSEVKTSGTKSPRDSTATRRPLEGRRICLVFDYSLLYYTRLLLEIEALQRAGATVQFVTQNADEDAPPGVSSIYAPLGAQSPLVESIVPSRLRWRVPRRADNILRNTARWIAGRWASGANSVRRKQTLQRMAEEVDIFWVIDFPPLERVIQAAKTSGARVVYETVDLVPEYIYRGTPYRHGRLDDERTLIDDIDGFITACDSYADYYMETYGDRLRRRPIVRDNMPREVVAQIVPTAGPLRLLFLGSLMFDRPVLELIEAVAEASTDVTLTFQGRNHLEEVDRRRVANRIAELGLQGRVEVLDPCPPDHTVEIASAYDVGVVALRGADENERRASTGKLFTYLAAGLAVLGSDLPGIARVVRAHDNGLLVDGLDPHAWAAAIDRLGSMRPALIDSMKQRSLRAANLYAWEKQEPAFVEEFVRALSSRSRGRRRNGQPRIDL